MTLVVKKEHLNEIKDTCKIICHSDFGRRKKTFEGFLKTWILEDLSENGGFNQLGGKKGIENKHLLVSMINRILKMLDTREGRALEVKLYFVRKAQLSFLINYNF